MVRPKTPMPAEPLPIDPDLLRGVAIGGSNRVRCAGVTWVPIRSGRPAVGPRSSGRTRFPVHGRHVGGIHLGPARPSPHGRTTARDRLLRPRRASPVFRSCNAGLRSSCAAQFPGGPSASSGTSPALGLTHSDPRTESRSLAHRPDRTWGAAASAGPTTTVRSFVATRQLLRLRCGRARGSCTSQVTRTSDAPGANTALVRHHQAPCSACVTGMRTARETCARSLDCFPDNTHANHETSHGVSDDVHRSPRRPCSRRVRFRSRAAGRAHRRRQRSVRLVRHERR